jgi:hypothetical protein
LSATEYQTTIEMRPMGSIMTPLCEARERRQGIGPRRSVMYKLSSRLLADFARRGVWARFGSPRKNFMVNDVQEPRRQLHNEG